MAGRRLPWTRFEVWCFEFAGAVAELKGARAERLTWR